MNRENTQSLYQRYPRLFRGREMSLQQNLMPFGFGCGNGWFEIVDSLAAKIETECQRLMDEEGVLEEDLPIAVQVKEKYGTLHFYMTRQSDAMTAAIREAEAQSAVTCEQCGAPGTMNQSSWKSVACPAHKQEGREWD
jgi:hypothetical protein